MESLQPIEEFIATRGISMSAWRVAHNPHMPDTTMRHWRCTLRVTGRTMVVPFSQGSAHKSRPTAAEVLDCLASDASTIENNRTFEEWASELGCDEDSRKAERTYRACVKQTENLRAWLGDEQFQSLLYRVERL